jgi:y4mF family transcriptional regulator
LDYSKENLIFATKSQQTVNSKEIGKTIKARRQALGVTQQTLADLADVGINTLVAIERGQGNPKLETLLTVLDTLGLQLDIHL